MCQKSKYTTQNNEGWEVGKKEGGRVSEREGREG